MENLNKSTRTTFECLRQKFAERYMNDTNPNHHVLLARLLVACIAGLLLQIHASAQTPALPGELQQLQFLVGEWKGEGCQLRPDGSRQNRFSQKTKVQASGIRSKNQP